MQNLRVGANWRSIVPALGKAALLHREGPRLPKARGGCSSELGAGGLALRVAAPLRLHLLGLHCSQPHAQPSRFCGCRCILMPMSTPLPLPHWRAQARLDAARDAATAAFHLCPNLGLLLDAMLAHPPEEWEARCPLTPGAQQGWVAGGRCAVLVYYVERREGFFLSCQSPPSRAFEGRARPAQPLNARLEGCGPERYLPCSALRGAALGSLGSHAPMRCWLGWAHAAGHTLLGWHRTAARALTAVRRPRPHPPQACPSSPCWPSRLRGWRTRRASCGAARSWVRRWLVAACAELCCAVLLCCLPAWRHRHHPTLRPRSMPSYSVPTHTSATCQPRPSTTGSARRCTCAPEARCGQSAALAGCWG